MTNAKMAFVGFGEINTDRQVIERKCGEALARLREMGEVFATEPVDDGEGYEQADRAVRELGQADFDVLVVCLAGWIPTHAVIRVIDHFRHKPMILWGLCGWHEGERLISTADQAGTTALKFAMKQMDYRFRFVYSTLTHPFPGEKIEAYANACYAYRKLRDARLGTMGYRDMLLYGTMADGVALRSKIGVEIEPFEMLEMRDEAAKIDEAKVREGVAFARAHWRFETECADEPIADSVRWALAIKARVERRGYDAVTLIDVDGMKKLMGMPPSMVFMLLDAYLGVCTIPENDVMGGVTQLMVRYLTGQIAAYGEFYEFFDESLLVGVPDYIPGEVTCGQGAIRPSTFGLLTTSLLCASKFKTGQVTMARLIDDHGKYKMHLVRGEAKKPPQWEESGWAPPAPQLPSLEIAPEGGVENFAEKVSSQHIILAYGDHEDEIRQLCALLDVEIL